MNEETKKFRRRLKELVDDYIDGKLPFGYVDWQVRIAAAPKSSEETTIWKMECERLWGHMEGVEENNRKRQRIERIKYEQTKIRDA